MALTIERKCATSSTLLGLRITASWRLLGTASCSGSAWAAWLRGNGL